MKHAVFFCENCGKPVPLDAEECPHCHSRFTAVQCPKCSFIGEGKLFASGCPRCGYLAQPYDFEPTSGVSRTSADGSGSATGPQNPKTGGQGAGGENATANEEQGTTAPLPKYRRSSARLPGWFYTVASILLMIVLIILGVIILNLK